MSAESEEIVQSAFRRKVIPTSSKEFPFVLDAQFVLKGLGLIAFLCLTVRAYVQSITIDEAESFLMYVARPSPWHWDAAANNHVLNSLLMRLSTLALGVSPFTLRLPALAGAAIYITSAYLVCKQLFTSNSLRLIAFVCLVYNPFIQDYLVAARGYSLALGFLLFAMAAILYLYKRENCDALCVQLCGLCSVSIALSAAANFSFGIVCAVTGLVLIVAAVSVCRRSEGAQRGAMLRLLSACILPGLIAGVLLCGPTVARWPRGQLVFGAASMAQTAQGIVQASMWRPNPYVLNPWTLAWMEACRPYLIPVLGLLWTCAAVLGVWQRSFFQERARGIWTATLALHAVFFLTLIAHWVLHVAFGVLLPRDRTASFFVPLATLCLCCWAALPGKRLTGKVIQGLLAAGLGLLGFYYVGCLRLTYFREWYWNADSRTVYSVVSAYSRKYGVKDVPVTWKCVAALNFYRYMHGDNNMDEFRSEVGKYPSGKSIYVLDEPVDWRIIQSEGLEVVYRGQLSEIVVAVRPGIDAK